MKITLIDTLQKRKKSQYWLAKETGIAASTISNLCTGKTTRIDFDVIEKICDALNCTPNDIIMPNKEHGVINKFFSKLISILFNDNNVKKNTHNPINSDIGKVTIDFKSTGPDIEKATIAFPSGIIIETRDPEMNKNIYSYIISLDQEALAQNNKSIILEFNKSNKGDTE